MQKRSAGAPGSVIVPLHLKAGPDHRLSAPWLLPQRYRHVTSMTSHFRPETDHPAGSPPFWREEENAEIGDGCGRGRVGLRSPATVELTLPPVTPSR